MADEIEALNIEGWRFGQYGPGLDPAVFAMFSGGSAWSDLPQGWSQQDALAGLANTTPPPEVIEELTVTGDKAFVPPPVPPTLLGPAVEIVASIGSSIAAGVGGLVGLLLPSPTAPRELDEAPDPALEAVDITGRRKPPTPTLPTSPDVPLPPNWEDLSRPNQPIPVDSPFWFTTFPTPVPDDERTDRERQHTPLPRSPRSDTDDGDLEELTITGRRPRPVPTDLGAPYVFGDSFTDLPFGFPAGLPAPEPLAQPAPSRRARPVRSPVTYANPLLFASPTLDPLLVDFLQPTTSPIDEVVPDLEVPVPVDVPPRVATPTRPTPLPFIPPGLSLDPFDPLAPQPQPQPTKPTTPTRADSCDCEKKKPKKQKKPRALCYRGGYVETRTGLKKTPRELVDCDTGQPF